MASPHSAVGGQPQQLQEAAKPVFNQNEPQPATRRVHVFYYPWYANPATDNEWNHWNHNILPHWSASTRDRFPHDINYKPPNDIGSNFYPSRGPYSSADPLIVDSHFQELKDYVIVVSWWGRHHTDGEGKSTEALMPLLFERAERCGAKLAFHLEPYKGRTHLTVKDDMIYLYEKYGSSPALYREAQTGQAVVYVYDSYLTPASDWAKILTAQGSDSVRNTPHDAILLGLWVNADHGSALAAAGFDGFYTYFAAERFTYGSTSTNWKSMVEFGVKSGNSLKQSSLSVGPGYDDTRIRPWNAENRRSREDGQYYDRQWTAALAANPSFISVTSYNEWMEGTQIEAAQPNRHVTESIYDGKSYSYLNYVPLPEDYYIQATARWAKKFTAK